MALSKEQINRVEEVLKVSLRNKFREYKPEADSKPFQTRLLGMTGWPYMRLYTL